MNPDSLFSALSAPRIAGLIAQATRRVCYANPGIQLQPAQALADLSQRSPRPEIIISLDFNEHTLRMGYGSLQAVKVLREAGIPLSQSPGFRSAFLIVDDQGWIFTPTALYLETEPQSAETPNAIQMGLEQVTLIMTRFSPAAREEAAEAASSPTEATAIRHRPLQISEAPMPEEHFKEVQESIAQAPPVKFDIVRQVRVFEPYLQYIELNLTGAAVQRHRVRIPESLQNLGASTDLEGRLRTTFDLIEKGGNLSSKSLELQLNQIRKDFTPSLGKDHGRVLLKAAKTVFLQRLQEFRGKLEAHQKKVQTELQTKLDESREQIVDYYLPLALKDVPDAITGSLLTTEVDEAVVRGWIESELSRVFPDAASLVQKMTLEERFKDITYETLNQPDFLSALRNAFPKVNWDKAYDEFKAAGESQPNA